MDKEKTLIVLWIIFGFVFIKAIDSILYFVIHLMYFGLAELEVSYNVMTYIFPILTFILYSLTAIFLVRRLNNNSNHYLLQLDNFPMKIFIISTAILVLYPLTNKLFGIYAANYSTHVPSDMNEYLNFSGWFISGFTISKILVITGLIFYSFLKLKNHKTSKPEF